MNPNKEPPSGYISNLERFACFCPEAAKQMETVDCKHLQFCKTQAGELNLRVADREKYYHSQEGAMLEANQWLEEIFPIDVNVVCVFGIGLGYYYDVLSSWLQNNPGNYLVFIEDDLAVLHRFLETGERAHKILNDTQVVIQYSQNISEKKWDRFLNEFRWFFLAFGNSQVRFSALKHYQVERSTLYKSLYNQLWMYKTDASLAYIELYDNQELCAFNYYSNFLSLPRSGQGIDLKNKFPGIPLIICGAGPSLGKHLEKLPKLYDRALILGSGTGMNILTRRGIRPHFGLGADPYDASEGRFLTSLAYEMPFLYIFRFSHKALKIIHSPILMLQGRNPYPLTDWFESQLNLPETNFSAKGISSSNLCSRVGVFFECNPIILIGMDLAYTDDSRYTAGAAVHPTTDRVHHQQLHEKYRKTIPAVGLNGEPLLTKWEWILEASFFTQFAQENPGINFINATEGGLKIIEIPDFKFDEVIEKQLTRSYDLQNWMHCEVQNSYNYQMTEQQMMDILQKWQESFEKCIAYCDQKKEALDLLAKRMESEEELPISPKALSAEIMKELNEQPAFNEFMKHYNDYYDHLAFPEMNKVKLFPDQYPPRRSLTLEIEMNKGRLNFFKSLADVHIKALKDSLSGYKQRPQSPLKVGKPPKPSPVDIYELKDGLYRIHDPELEIDFEEKFSPEMISLEKRQQGHERATFLTSHEDVFDGQALLFYPLEGVAKIQFGAKSSNLASKAIIATPSSGSIKGESYYSAGQLHGPSSFYAADGTLMARSWFIRGQRIGKTWQYYKTGELYSLQRYKEGKLHGKQEYYYPSGVLKTELHYVDDLLDGTISLYFPSGKLKREQHFRAGILQGIERMWNEDGQLILEAEFNQNLPTGRSRTWYPNGQLSKEIVFYDNPLNFDLRMWNDRGQLTHTQLSLPENPIGETLKKSADLQRTIQELTAKLKDLSK